MKKLIYSYLFLFIPLIISAQTYPHQIEPDTTHRMIMMTDTSVIDSPAMEFLYFSIDSLVEQIARDTLGLDTTYWSLDDSLSLSPINQTNNIILGSLSGNTSLAGSYNFLAGGSLGNSLTTGGYNTLFGVGNLSSLTTGSYTFSFGNSNGGSDSNTRVSFLGGFQNAQNATNIDNSFILGDRNNDSGAALIDASTLLGQFNVRNATDVSDAFISGYNNGGGTGYYNQVFINGRDNNTSGNRLNYTFINGSQNAINVVNTTGLFINGFQNVYSADLARYTFANGRDNLRSATRADYNFVSGYRNIYQSTSNVSNIIAIGYENGYNPVDHSNSIYLGYRQGYSNGAANKLLIGMAQDDPLIDGSFSADSLRVNGTLSIRDKTGTAGNFAAFDGDKIIDSGVSTVGDPDQTLSFSDPNLTISGSGGNTIDISSVNYWNKTGSNLNYTGGRVGVGTASPGYRFHVSDTMFVDAVLLDGNQNTGTTGYIMTGNAGKPLWESPSAIGLSEFTNDAGFLTSEVDGSTTNELQTLSFSDPNLTIASGNSVDISAINYWGSNINGLFTTDNVGIGTTSPSYDLHVAGTMYLRDAFRDGANSAGTNGQLLQNFSGTSTRWVSKSAINLSDFNNDLGITSSPWSLGAGDDIYYNTGTHNVGIGTTNPTVELHVVGDARITGDISTAGDLVSTSNSVTYLDFNGGSGDPGSNGELLGHDGSGLSWLTPEISLTPPVLMCYQSSSQSISSSGGFISVPNTVNDSGFGTSTTQKTVPLTGYYRVSAAGTVTASTGNDFNYAINGGVTVTQDVDTAGSYGFSYSTILYMTSGTTVGLYMDATSSGNTVDEISLDINYIKS